METDRSKIKALSKEKEDENWKFRSYLKSSDIPPEEIDRIVRELYEQTSSMIDCKTCGNCCRVVQPLLDEEDVERLSAGLDVPAFQFKAQYLIDDRTSRRFFFEEKPCPLLEGNLCLYYEYRPRIAHPIHIYIRTGLSSG